MRIKIGKIIPQSGMRRAQIYCVLLHSFQNVENNVICGHGS